MFKYKETYIKWLRYLLAGQAECANTGPLINGSNPIPDAYMTASSEYSSNWRAPNARLNGPKGWCANDTERDTAPPNYYIQVRNVIYIHYYVVLTRLY